MDKKKINRMKKLKSSLVQTRNTIKKKFQKLHTDLFTEEKKRKEKYKPITNSIEKLIGKNNASIQASQPTNQIDIDMTEDVAHEHQDQYEQHWNDLDTERIKNDQSINLFHDNENHVLPSDSNNTLNEYDSDDDRLSEARGGQDIEIPSNDAENYDIEMSHNLKRSPECNRFGGITINDGNQKRRKVMSPIQHIDRKKKQ